MTGFYATATEAGTQTQACPTKKRIEGLVVAQPFSLFRKTSKLIEGS